MKKMICLLLSLLMVLSLVACGEREEGVPAETTQPTEQETTTQPDEPEVAPLDSFFVQYQEEQMEEPYYMQASLDGDGNVEMEYKTALGRKKATMPMEVMIQLAYIYEQGELRLLNGQDIYEEGTASASLYITRGEESCAYNYCGSQIPEGFKIIYDALAEGFREMMAEVDEYVPTPLLGEDLNEAETAAIMEILNGSGIASLDSLMIMNIAKDEYFAENAGLSGAEGIVSATSCTALLMTVPYSLVVVTVEEGTEPAAIAAGFTQNINWLKWVCVQPTDATIAVKDNMVLCLMGQDEMYFGTAAAIQEAGWNVVDTLKNTNV